MSHSTMRVENIYILSFVIVNYRDCLLSEKNACYL